MNLGSNVVTSGCKHSPRSVVWDQLVSKTLLDLHRKLGGGCSSSRTTTVFAGGIVSLESNGFAGWAPSSGGPTRMLDDDLRSTRFHLGSVGKLWTASMIREVIMKKERKQQQLRGGEGDSLATPAFSWDSSVQEILKGSARRNQKSHHHHPLLSKTPERLEKQLDRFGLLDVKLHQLIDHRSGIDDATHFHGIDHKSPSGIRKLLSLLWRNGLINVHGAAQELWAPLCELDKEICLENFTSTATHDDDLGGQMMLFRGHILEKLISSLSERDVHTAKEDIARDQKEQRWLYSNFGLGLAAVLTEMHTGKPYEALIQDYLVKEFGLNEDTVGFGEPALSLSKKGLPTAGGAKEERRNGPYDVVGHATRQGLYDLVVGNDPTYSPRPSAECPSVIQPAGDIHASIMDLATFLRSHLNEMVSDPPRHTPVLREMPPFYVPKQPNFSAARGGKVSESGGISMNYRNGMIIDETSTPLMINNRTSLEKSSYEKQVKKAKAKGVPNIELPLNFSHDGSTGSWYTYFCIVPEYQKAAFVCLNAAPLSVQNHVVVATKTMLKKAHGASLEW